MQGPQGATSKLNALGRSLVGERDSLVRQLNRRRLSPKEAERIEGRISAIETAISKVDGAIKGLTGGGAGGNKTKSGVSWSVEQ